MSGRIERIDGRLELYSEPNYASIDFFFLEERRRKWKARAEKAVIFVAWVAYCWLVIARAVEP